MAYYFGQDIATKLAFESVPINDRLQDFYIEIFVKND